MIANEGSEPYDFEVPVTNDMNLNLTMTTAPRTKKNSDLIEVFFDGIFDTPKGQASKSKRPKPSKCVSICSQIMLFCNSFSKLNFLP